MLYIPKYNINKFSPNTIRKFALVLLVIPQVILLFIYGQTPVIDFFNIIKSYKQFDPHLMRNLFFALLFERMVYTFIWMLPKKFEDFANLYPVNKIGNTIDVVISFFYVSKVLQIGGLVYWYLLTAPCIKFSQITPFQWVTGLQLIIFGQILNISTYLAIGKNGVYYGNKFGKKIPWYTGFPFNVFTVHPQYCGATATVFGVIVLFATEAHAKSGIFFVGIFQAILYVYMAFVESI